MNLSNGFLISSAARWTISTGGDFSRGGEEEEEVSTLSSSCTESGTGAGEEEETGRSFFWGDN